MNKFKIGDVVIDKRDNKLIKNYVFINLIIGNTIFYKFNKDPGFSRFEEFWEIYSNIFIKIYD